MAIVKFYQPVPVKDPVVGADRQVSLIWQRWFNFVAQRLGVVSEGNFTYDPPAIAAGGSASASVSFPGARPGNFAWAAHTQVVAGIIISATATTDSVTVTFNNVTGAPIDMASGTLRIRVEASQ